MPSTAFKILCLQIMLESIILLSLLTFLRSTCYEGLSVNAHNQIIETYHLQYTMNFQYACQTF